MTHLGRDKHVWSDEEEDALKRIGLTRFPPGAPVGGQLDLWNRVWRALDEHEHLFIVKVVKKDSVEIQALRRLLTSSSPRNYTVPAELIECSDTCLILMPALGLFRTSDYATMDIRALLRALQQLADGLQFIHENCIAHMDVALVNIVYSDYHVKVRSFDVPPATTYYIDFDVSRVLSSGPGTGVTIDDFRVAGGGRYIPPEGIDILDPYAYDVYCLGTFLRVALQEIVDRKGSLRIPPTFFRLTDMMTMDDPKRRPTMFRVRRLVRALNIWTISTGWLYRICRLSIADSIVSCGWSMVSAFVR